MKPNDKAIEAAADAIKENGPYYAGSKIRDGMAKHLAEVALPAAYAAHFKSKEYAGLVKQLRDWGAMNYKLCDEAADAIEAVLAEMDMLREENENIKAANRYGKDWVDQASQDITRLRAERDTLAARLAPVDDEALVEIVAHKIFIERRSLAAAIAAIRPHIEAAEREKVLREIRENNQAIRKLANDWGMEIKIEQIRSGK